MLWKMGGGVQVALPRLGAAAVALAFVLALAGGSREARADEASFGPPPEPDEAWWTDRLALTGGLGFFGAPRANYWGATDDLQAQLRYGGFLVGALYSGEFGALPSLAPTSRGDRAYITANTLALSLEGRVRLGVVALEAGGAAGGQVLAVSQPLVESAVDLLPYLRGMVTVSTPFQERVDVFGRVVVSSTFGDVNDAPIDGRPGSTALLLGLRAHFGETR